MPDPPLRGRVWRAIRDEQWNGFKNLRIRNPSMLSWRRWVECTSVTFFAAVVLLAETLFFHVTKFIVDFLQATCVIGCAAVGVAIGACLAGCWRPRISTFFSACCAGTTASLYIAAYVLLRQPRFEWLLLATSGIFVFPSAYIAGAFERGSVSRVYFFDLLGAALGVAVAVLAFGWLGSEEIFLAVVALLPIAGLVPLLDRETELRVGRVSLGLGLIVAACMGSVGLYQQLRDDRFNVVRLVNPAAPSIPMESMLRRKSRLRVTDTYDNLVGRIDVLPSKGRTFVTYDGFFNDNFTSAVVRDYQLYAAPDKVRFPVMDKRVFYGFVTEPAVFVVGPAAQGIIKTLRAITPVEKIDAVEINPGILQIMQQDYYDASGRAYEGLRPVLGNALAALRQTDKRYDIITLVNTHSSRWIGTLGPPDYLHTLESYHLYFDHLTDAGYLLFEERPTTQLGEMALRRLIATLYESLRQRGVQDPSRHFFVWEFMSRRFYEQGLSGIQPGSDMYYVGMVVTREPIDDRRQQDIAAWYEHRLATRGAEPGSPTESGVEVVQPAYLKNVWNHPRFGPFFDLLAAGDLRTGETEFDYTPVTNDRPFPAYVPRVTPEVEQLVWWVAQVCLGFCGALAIPAAWGAHQPWAAMLIVYQVLIGFAYFLVEVMLMHVYQHVLISPTTSLAVVLGALLIGSGIGGQLATWLPPSLAIVALVPCTFVGVRGPEWMLTAGWSNGAIHVASVAMIFVIGMAMGVYFPSGLSLARRQSLGHKIPYLFGINALAGSAASVVSLYCGMRWGYFWTLMLAIGLFGLASMMMAVAGARVRSATRDLNRALD